MRKLLRKLLAKPVVAIANKWSSRPDQGRVDNSLTDLYQTILKGNPKKGLVITFTANDKFIILSDQHKGARDGADVFALAERNYLAALEYYNENKYFYINLGDSEELWENLFITVKRHNTATFAVERKFLEKKKFIKIYGNHDLYWGNDPLAQLSLKSIYGQKVAIHEGLVLRFEGKHALDIYMTHGHQGDLQSDGNWFSKWFVSDIWAPFQAYLRINPNTPANNEQLKTDHNRIMYQWSSKQKNTLLITGHTHQPVFKSVTHLEKLLQELETAKKQSDTAAIKSITKQIGTRKTKGDLLPDFDGYLDTYFNSGCCCFDDGDITGIEIADGCIRLIKWKYDKHKVSSRLVLEQSRLEDLKLG